MKANTSVTPYADCTLTSNITVKSRKDPGCIVAMISSIGIWSQLGLVSFNMVPN